MRNARFWTSLGAGDAKITLRDGQSLEHHRGGYHDEGWWSTHVRWTFADGVVEREVVNDGTDCDGRLTRHYLDRCPVGDLAAIDVEGEAERFPRWQRVTSDQRDEFAEAAGY